MNYFVKSLVLFGVLAIAGTTAKAQLKIGYINSAELIELMPETKVVDSQLTVFAKGLEENLQTMQKTFDEKLADYRENQATMADAIKQTRERELQDLNQRIQQFQVKSQQDYLKKQNELMAPILKMAQDAINAVAADGNYTYVFDTSNTGLLVKPVGDNILPLVKKKLRL
ncbi:MAG TPA: OmpH family outer membrane protein [Anseongella sp.]